MRSQKSYSWLEIANMPLCCVCCGSRNINIENDTCNDCGSDEGLWADERTNEEYANENTTSISRKAGEKQ